jgi:hypothetical protein
MLSGRRAMMATGAILGAIVAFALVAGPARATSYAGCSNDWRNTVKAVRAIGVTGDSLVHFVGD